jgi:hypothetical protein
MIGWALWYPHVIAVSWTAEIRRIVVRSQPRDKVRSHLSKQAGHDGTCLYQVHASYTGDYRVDDHGLRPAKAKT